MHLHAGVIYLVENDPGLPPGEIDDPFAGLDEATAAVLGGAGRVCEGKAIGDAVLTANVGARDAALRQRYGTVVGATQQRRVMRLAAKNAMRDLQPHIEKARTTLSRLMDSWLAGDITLSQMRIQSAAALREAYEGARQVGRKASGLSRMGAATRGLGAAVQREEEQWFRDAVREELGFWHRFLDEIAAGKVSEARRAQRLEAFIKAIRFMFDAARVQALPDNVLLYWMGPKRGDPNICEGCALMMEWSPFPKSQIPAVPRDGSTPCLTNCRHRIVVRVASDFNDVIRRANQLDKLRIRTRTRPRSSQPRARMAKKLQEVKMDAHGGRRRGVRVRGRAGNPFAKERLPKAPRYRGRLGQMRAESLRDEVRHWLDEATGRSPQSAAAGSRALSEGAPVDDGRETCGVFIRLPPRLANQFPALPADEDTSPPHATLLYVGPCNATEYGRLCDAMRRMVREHDIRPFVVELSDYGEFANPEGKTIPHMIPRAYGEPSLARLHQLALRYAQHHAGLDPQHHRDGPFKPHVTLAYMEPGKTYDGPRPQGTWQVDALEVWGEGAWGKGDLGVTRIPLVGGTDPIDEALDRPVDFFWRDRFPFHWEGEFAVDGQEFRVDFDRVLHRDGDYVRVHWEVHFHVRGPDGKWTNDMTGTLGQRAFTVFATVGAMMLQVHKAMVARGELPSAWEIHAKADEASRVRLYRTLAKRWARTLGGWRVSGPKKRTKDFTTVYYEVVNPEAPLYRLGEMGRSGRRLIPVGESRLDEVNIAEPKRTFDSVPYSAMDLRDLSRLLVAAAKKRDENMLLPVLDRLVSALEHTVLAVEGRPRAMQVAKMLRRAFVEMVAAFRECIPESVVEPLDRLDIALCRLEERAQPDGTSVP